MLIEDINHTIRNVAFDYLVLNIYGNSFFLDPQPNLLLIPTSMQMSSILWVPPQSLSKSKAL